jgi:hypothetical protein
MGNVSFVVGCWITDHSLTAEQFRQELLGFDRIVLTVSDAFTDVAGC